MAEEDSSAYRRLLTEILDRYGFRWVAEQAELQISEGKPGSKQVSEADNSLPTFDAGFTIPRRRRRRSSLVTSLPYTEKEQLDILLKAIRSAILERASIELAIFDSLSNVQSVTFLPDESTDPAALFRPEGHILQRESEPVLREISKIAESALDEIKGATT